MARERWFYAHDDIRHGPHQLPELVDALLALPEPRTRLVWKRGLETWTRAGRVPGVSDELNRQLPEPERPSPPVAPAREPARRTQPPAHRPVSAPPEVAAETGIPRPALYAGGGLLLAIAIGAAVIGLRGGDPEPAIQPVAVGGGAGGTGGAPADPGSTGAAAGTATAAATGDPAVVGWAGAESDVPATEFALLKGVAAWSGDELTITLYNGSRWRITEILVRTSVLEGEQFVDSALLHPLTPRQEVDANVAPILEQVAPDRRRPAVNPDDTRSFTGKAGQKPRAYRWRIEAARGYAPVIR